MRRAPACIVAVIVGGALFGAGCGQPPQLAQPTCSANKIEPLVLVAQTVPTATRVPCIAGYPAGWQLSGFTARDGRATIKFDSDRGGTSALKVRLEHTCDLAGATEVPTDEVGAHRFERILSVDNGFKAIRSYQFDGGCVTYRLNFKDRSQALVNEASLVVNLISRAEVDRRYREHTDGRAHL